METYSFSHSDENGVMTSVSFTVPATGTHISSFHRMCCSFAAAVGYAEKSIEAYFGEISDEAFEEFETNSHLVR